MDSSGKERPPSLSPPPSANPATAGPSMMVAWDMFANPCHASQLAPAFTQQYALKQALEEGKRAADAKRLANIEQAKHSVMVYGWAKVS